ncbi:MAG: hypothetical protein DRJ42_29265, partial [Deltaproteobacteria bacterium]
MEEVHAHQQVGDDVERRDDPVLKAEDDVVVDVLRIVVAAVAKGQVQEVVDDVEGDDGAAQMHRARGVVGDQVLARLLVGR